VLIGRAIAEHVELLKNRTFMPLAKLFSVQSGSREYNEEDKQGLFYAESWALVHYMMFNSEQRRAQFNAFVSDLAGGAPADHAFEKAFGMDLNSFQKIFEAYIQQHMAWNAFQVNTPGGLDRTRDIKSTLLTEAEAEFYVGDLLLHIRRLPEAESHIANAVKLDPKLGPAQSAMGQVLMEKKDAAGALPYFQRAVELSPDNFLTHFYYAAALYEEPTSTSNKDFATIHSELQKTVQLAPQYVEAIDMLASVNLTQNQDIDQTVELLANAINFAPGRDDLILKFANALSRTDRWKTAQVIVRNLLAKPTLEGWIRQNAMNLQDYMERRAAFEASARSTPLPAAPLPREITPESALESDRPPVIRRATPDETVVYSDPAETPAAANRTPAEEPVPAGMQRMRGILTLLDCKDGMMISLSVDGKVVKFHSLKPENIDFTSENPQVNGQIQCGPAPNKGIPASIIYRPQPSGESVGDPLRVRFLKN